MSIVSHNDSYATLCITSDLIELVKLCHTLMYPEINKNNA